MILVLLLSTLIAITFHNEAEARKKRALERSVERYVAAREAAVAAIAVTVLGTTLGILFGLVGIYTLSAMTVAMPLLWIFKAKEHLEDDDWLNNQRQRFKRSLKQLRQRLAVAPRLSLI